MNINFVKKIHLVFFLTISFTFSTYSQISESKNIDDSSLQIINSKRSVVSIEPEKALVKNDLNGLLSLENKIFGYAVFHNNEIDFSPNLNMPTPADYILGPGDEISLSVYGVAEKTYNLKISNEGKVRLDNIGVVSIGGLTIEEAKRVFKQKMSIRYSGVVGSTPNTFIDLALNRIRSIKINMIGEVSRPGTYTLPSYVKLFNAIYAAGGPTSKGTFRGVQLIRENKLVAEIDLYSFLINGETDKNLRLEDNDIILVRPAQIKVVVAGEIRTPGVFELKPFETLENLLYFASGFSSKAERESVKLTRIGKHGYKVMDIKQNNYSTFEILDGDSVFVYNIFSRFSNRVQISGSVKRPGAYELLNGMYAEDLIQKAGGLNGDAHKQRALIYRTNEDLTQEIISINLNDSISKKHLLKREDVLRISSIYDLKEQLYVQISGEVNKPGVYPFTDSLSIDELILTSGGLKYSASNSGIEIARRVLGDPSKIENIIKVSTPNWFTEKKGELLMPFDHVFIRNSPGFQEQQTVTVTGEVNYKGVYAIDKKGMKISDLLIRAGGLTKFAYPRGATLMRKNIISQQQSLAQKENLLLFQLSKSILSDPILSTSESNIEYLKNIRNKIEVNNELISKEKEILKTQEKSQLLLKENANIQNIVDARTIEEKDQNLVAVNLESIISSPGSLSDIVLRDGDVLNIPEKLETVSILGGVLYPGLVRHQEGLKFKDYINQAGGFDSKALIKKSYVAQANGKIERVKQFLIFNKFPKVESGAKIFVPSSIKERVPLNYTQTVQMITGFITSTLTLFLVLKNL